MEIREAEKADLYQLMELYTQLHDNLLPDFDESLEALWNEMLVDRNHHIIVGFDDRQLITSCVAVIIPNLTRGQRPYALIENVITREEFRNRGYATQILEYARQIAEKAHCYKMMLLTSSKEESTLHFYEKAGYNQNDKTAFIQWLN